MSVKRINAHICVNTYLCMCTANNKQSFDGVTLIPLRVSLSRTYAFLMAALIKTLVYSNAVELSKHKSVYLAKSWISHFMPWFFPIIVINMSCTVWCKILNSYFWIHSTTQIAVLDKDHDGINISYQNV